MYIGSTDVRGPTTFVWEVVDNSIDERWPATPPAST